MTLIAALAILVVAFAMAMSTDGLGSRYPRVWPVVEFLAFVAVVILFGLCIAVIVDPGNGVQ